MKEIQDGVLKGYSFGKLYICFREPYHNDWRDYGLLISFGEESKETIIVQVGFGGAKG